MRMPKARKTRQKAPEPSVRGRPKLYGLRIVLPLAEGTLADIDAIISDGETRLDVIRMAIEREITRRLRSR